MKQRAYKVYHLVKNDCAFIMTMTPKRNYNLYQTIIEEGAVSFTGEIYSQVPVCIVT